MPALQRYKTIIGLGLPIIGGMLSQSVLNLIDAALVGQLGEASLAGVGIGSYANFVAISLILGLSSAVQTLVARRQGQGRGNQITQPVFVGILVAMLFALPLSFMFIQFSEVLVATMTTKDSVQNIAVDYFDYRTAAMIAIAMNLSFRGWWNGTQRPVTYFKVLIFTHLLNIAVSYCLIFGYAGLPLLGAPGAGLGTAIALFSGAYLNGWLVYKDTRLKGLKLFDLTRLPVSSVLRLAIPNSMQQVLFSLAICVLMWTISQIGTEDQAIAHVLINLSLFLILPAVGFGVASTTLVSHALGEQNPAKALQYGWDVIVVAMGGISLLSIPLLIAPEFILNIFLQTQPVIETAILPLQLTAIAIILDAAAIVLAQSLLGVGDGRNVLIITGCSQWLFYLPLAWFVGPYLGFGILGIWIVQLIHRTLSSVVFIAIWKQRHWLKIEI
ncbi:MAG: MATE family efflux transporter [Neptuniibacter sp.]